MALTDKLTAIGDAIRAKNGTTAKIPLSDMPNEIKKISGMDDKVATYNAVKSRVSEYLTDADKSYTESNTASVSVAANHLHSVWDYDDKPNGHEITVPAAGTLHVADEKSGGGYVETVAAGTHTIYNLCPDRTYRWWISDASGATIANGRLKATGALREIYLNPKARNFRDIGGMKCDGGTVKYGMIYRGSQLDGDFATDAASYAILHDRCGIRAEIDMRESPPQDYSLIGTDVAYHHDPLPDNFGSYKHIVNPDTPAIEKQAMEILKTVVDSVRKGCPTYLHCTYGADRTGAMCCLIEGLLGVLRVDIDKDYELTNFAYGNKSRTNALWVGLINQINTYSGSSFRDKIVTWVKGMGGITAKELNDFRAAMIDGTPTAITWSFAITKSLTNCTASGAASVASGAAYESVLTPSTDYTLKTVRVTMDGVDVTAAAYEASARKIHIASVTGNVVITASAEKAAAPIIYPTNPEITWYQGKNLNYNDGVTITDSAQYAYCDYVPVDANATYTSTMKMTFSDNNYRVLCYDTDKKYLGVGFSQQKNGSSWCCATKYANTAYVRFRLYANSATNLATECANFVLTKS